MKKITGLLIAIMLIYNANASEITFVKSVAWNKIIEKATKENKMIFFDAFASWCGPCKYLEKDIYTNEEVAIFYNKNFINVKFDMEKGEGIKLAEEFGITSYPTLMFFTPDGKMVHKYVGAMEAPQFINLGKDAQIPSKQYFTIKEKASKLLLTDTEFNAWAALADQLQDNDKEQIVAAWLATKSDILENREIAATVFSHADKLSDVQLGFLYNNQNKIDKLMKWDAARTASILYKKLFTQALSVYLVTKSIDSFSTIIKKFDAKKENYAVKDLLFKEALLVALDKEKATVLLIQYLKDIKKPIGIDKLAGWLLDYSSKFETHNLMKINEQLKTFKFRPMDKGKEYWLWLMQMICNTKTGNKAAEKAFAKKAYRHPDLPSEYREILKENYGVSN